MVDAPRLARPQQHHKMSLPLETPILPVPESGVQPGMVVSSLKTPVSKLVYTSERNGKS